MMRKFLESIKDKIGWRLLDSYILKKFLGSFFYSIALLMTIIIVFDISENINMFLDAKASLGAIIFQYYFNFIPYFINLFTPLFTFISVIFFTSQLSSRNEIISIFNGGVSFYRFLVPYFVGALIIAVFSLFLSNFLIPKTNENLFKFKETYSSRKKKESHNDIHLKNSENSYIYLERWNAETREGENFTYEQLGDKSITYKIKAYTIFYNDSTKRWTLRHYTERSIVDSIETVKTGFEKDTVLSITPLDFEKNVNIIETMSYKKLRQFIKEEEAKGSDLVKEYEVEKYKRIANPMATIIMTLLGLSVASRKTRRGVGVHIFIGLFLAFSFIFFQQVTKVFAISGNLPPAIATWIPNILYLIICLFLLRFAQK